jgi:hypothetical protein
MSVFHRNRHHSTARAYVSWTPSTEPVDPADASATVSAHIPTDAAAVPEKLPDRPAPDER